jgi:hypothetical protein
MQEAIQIRSVAFKGNGGGGGSNESADFITVPFILTARKSK